MTDGTARVTVESYFDLIRDGDLGVADLFHDDARLVGLGTVIAGRTDSNVRVERITHVGRNNDYELDTKFPGTFTAADLFVNDERFATIIGLHLRYRKDKSGTFIGHPGNDLDALKKDFEELFADRQLPLIIAGDFNEEMEEFPKVFKKLGKGELSLVDAFESQPQATFQQDWGERHWYLMDDRFISQGLNNAVTSRIGGNVQFSSALEMSDHSPLLIEFDLDRVKN